MKKQNRTEEIVTKSFLAEILNESFGSLRKYLDENFLTKEEAKKFATKEDLERFATKDEVGSLKDNVEKLATELQEFRQETNDNFERLFDGAHEAGKVLGDHEKRITVLEHGKN